MKEGAPEITWWNPQRERTARILRNPFVANSADSTEWVGAAAGEEHLH
jgi:hypothetical protein